MASEDNALCASLERHSHRTYDALYPSAFELLKTRWRALTTHLDANIEQRCVQAIDRCREVIEEHQRRMAQQAALQVAQQAAQDARERTLQAAQEAASAQADAEAQLRKETAAVRGAAETRGEGKRAAR